MASIVRNAFTLLLFYFDLCLRYIRHSNFENLLNAVHGRFLVLLGLVIFICCKNGKQLDENIVERYSKTFITSQFDSMCNA